MAESDRVEVARLFTSAAAEFREAAAHLDTAARHFQAGDVPRGCAHAFAAQGHQSRGESAIDAATRIHADHANV